MASSILAFLKFFAIFAGGFFGMLALLVDYKDRETKKITTWGVVALLGVVISTLTGAISQAIDRHLEAQRGQRQAKQYAETLDQIMRAVLPLEPLRVELHFKLSPDVIDAKASPPTLKLKGHTFPPDGVFNSITVDTRLVKTPLPDESLAQLGMGGPGGIRDDLAFWGRVEKKETNVLQGAGQRPVAISYFVDIERFATWIASGRVLSIPDLPGTQVVIAPTLGGAGMEPEDVKELYEKMPLTECVIRFGSLRITLSGAGLRRVGQKYVYVLPPTLDEIYKLVE